MTLSDLEQRLVRADREIDLEIIKVLRMCDPTSFYDAENDCLAWYEPHPEAPGCPSELCGDALPKLTTSLDAAIALCERTLGRPSWRAGNLPSGRGFAQIGTNLKEHEAATPALALCLGCVRALIGDQ